MRKTTVIKNCEGCNKEMSMPQWLSKRRRFCSKLCNGARRRKETNKKYLLICLRCNKNYRRNHASNGQFCSRKCYWESLVSVNPSYQSLHNWVRKTLGKPDECSYCGKNNLYGHQIHWANISHDYKKDLNDFMRLCSGCHKRYDSGLIKIKTYVA